MKNIESNLKEKRTFKPSEKFVRQANLKNEDLATLLTKYNSEPDLFWKELASTELTWIKNRSNVDDDGFFSS